MGNISSLTCMSKEDVGISFFSASEKGIGETTRTVRITGALFIITMTKDEHLVK